MTTLPTPLPATVTAPYAAAVCGPCCFVTAVGYNGWGQRVAVVCFCGGGNATVLASDLRLVGGLRAGVN